MSESSSKLEWKAFGPSIATIDVVGNDFLLLYHSLYKVGNQWSIFFYPFEWLHFCEDRPNHCLVIHLFEALMECGRHNAVSMDPRSLKQKVVRHIDVNDIARHF